MVFRLMATLNLQVILVGICYKNILQDLNIIMQTPALYLLFLLYNTMIPTSTFSKICPPSGLIKEHRPLACAKT